MFCNCHIESEFYGCIVVHLCNEVSNNPIYDEILNGVITDLEVYETIQNLKNNKAPGTNKILNEYLKHSPPFLVKFIVNYSTLC